jgi:hypothetical protein
MGQDVRAGRGCTAGSTSDGEPKKLVVTGGGLPRQLQIAANTLGLGRTPTRAGMERIAMQRIR